MATVNHIRVARLNPAIARECEREHQLVRPDFPFWARPAGATLDPYERRANICPVCHTTRALGSGECLC